MKKLGILGGSFNPIHVAHLVMAQEAVDVLHLDKVMFIPAFIAPHKKGQRPASAKDRLAMVKRAIRGNRAFLASDLEIKRGGVSYTVDTLKALKRQFPKTQLYLIMGSDSLRDFSTWYAVKEILKLATLVVAARPGFQGRPASYRAVTLPTPLMDVSASEIRNRIRRGRSIKYLVPRGVEDYIKKHKLYRPGST